jgi:hypothetical protein
LGPATIVICVGLLAASATWLARCLRLGAAASHLLAVYLTAWTQVVVVCAVLSVGHHLTRASLVASLAGLAVASCIVWLLRGRPPGRLSRAHALWLARQLRDPILGVLAAVLIAGYAYALALAVLTPQNEGDPLVYELARAALWRQEHGIGLTGTTFDPRLDANPVVGEIGELAAMVSGGTERFVALGQLSAVLAIALGTYCLGRRVGLAARPALFGALAVPTLPVITLQSWTGGNDLVVASFTVAAASFVLGAGRAELALAAFATALAVGTKFTGPLALPILVLVVLAAPSGRRVRAILALLAGTVVGSGWYAANLVRTGDLAGGLAGRFDQTSPGGFGNRVQTATQLALDSIDGSGAIGLYVLAYATAGVALVLVLAAARARRQAYLAAVLVAVAPLAAVAVGETCAWLFSSGWRLAGNPETARLFSGWSLPTAANAYTSWYGPLAPLLVIGVLVFAVVDHRRGTPRTSAIVLAVAPIVMLGVLASTLAYDETRGRFLVGALAVGAATWGLVLRARWLAGGIAATCVVTFALVLVNAMAKPSGIQAGQYAYSPAVWTLERWEAQTLLRPSPPERDEASTVEFVEMRVPAAAAIALSVRSNDLLFPYFGARLSRRVELLDEADPVPADAGWLVAAPGRTPRGCRDSWRLAHERGKWRVWRRVSAGVCAATEVR